MKTSQPDHEERGASVSQTADAPWWRGAVIYQIYPRSFLDSNGDGIGDLKGVCDGLDYVAGLGVDGVWLSPFFSSPMHDFGYDVSDYCDVDPIFGSMADFDRIVEKAHALGLKVIIDQVYSHTSDQHAWFRESRSNLVNDKADWYVWSDPKPDGSPPNNWLSVFGGGAWEWDGRRRQYYFHNFLASQPDLNLYNMDVQDALLDVARFWLDRGVDGFRLDAINFAMHDPQLRDNPPALQDRRPLKRPFDYQYHLYNQSQPEIPQFLERLRRITDAYNGVFTVAEIGGPDVHNEMKSFTANGTRLNSAYDFSFLYADQLTVTRTTKAVGAWKGAPGEGWPSWAFSNHDAPRAISRWAAEAEREQAAKFYAMLLMSLRGNVFLYQGEELGLPQATVPFEALQDPEALANWPLTLGRDGARTPLPWKADGASAGFSSGTPWLPVDPAHISLAVNAQENNDASVLHFIRALIALRKKTPALRQGHLTFIKAGQDVLAFRRHLDGKEMLCIFNLGEEDRKWRPGDNNHFEIMVSVNAGAAGDALPETLDPLSGYIARAS
ncbi:MAG: alpha-amylase family glycosyl hydrolase [Pseudomonadota bacterium]